MKHSFLHTVISMFLVISLLVLSSCQIITDTTSQEELSGDFTSSAAESSMNSTSLPEESSEDSYWEETTDQESRESKEEYSYRDESPDPSSKPESNIPADSEISETPISSEESEESSQIQKDSTAYTGIQTVTFATVNDVHGYIEQDSAGKNGISNTAYAIQKLSQFYGDTDVRTDVHDDLVLFANGDMLQGTALSNMSYGRSVIEAMNQMGFDGMTLGNHEFDWGLDTILKYWDGDSSNGEANFPLLTANVSSDNRLIADDSTDDQIVTSVTLEKMGIKIGLIGIIGYLKSSILASAVKDYNFDDIGNAVRTEAIALREQGVQLIAVYMHDGNSSSVNSCSNNTVLANLKDSDGNYLVDLVFNGHTHTMQKGEITRSDGTNLPIVQGGSNNNGFSYIQVQYDLDSDAIVSIKYDYLYVSSYGTSCDKTVEKCVEESRSSVLSDLTVLAVSSVRISNKYDYADYVADIMIQAFDADYSIGNYGGLRSTGGINVGTGITAANLYEMIPFDNVVYVVEIQGNALYQFYNQNKDYYYLGIGDNAVSVAKLKGNTNYYKLAIIDYVYTGTYFNVSKTYLKNETQTKEVLRDLLIEDVRLHGEKGIKWNPEAGAVIGKINY